uniref:Helitron helicase-like domain-containing protein n=1 Tax=Vespula pensylvanica TaxID=30213 RepID=A0A834UD04_VESPE|nr:hypothetical protein H0235_004552 [Vespula pensylvanica]
MPKITNIERVKSFRGRQRTKNPPQKSTLQRRRKFQAHRKVLKNEVALISTILSAQTSIIDNVNNTANTSTNNETSNNTLLSSIEPRIPYINFNANSNAHRKFQEKFSDNPFGFSCGICDQLWFKNDLKKITSEDQQLLIAEFPRVNLDTVMACKDCIKSLSRGHIPIYSTSNGFVYPQKPSHLPELDLVSERLISPYIPFIQIRRLRHVHKQNGIFGQIINIPVSVNNIVRQLPRNIDNDHCINVHIKKKKIHRSSYLMGFVNKHNIKMWLQYLTTTPLYRSYDITINQSFFDNTDKIDVQRDEVSEDIPIECDRESLIGQQQTLLWNNEKYLQIAPGDRNVSHNVLFDEHAEELSFPNIYFGQSRVFKEGLRVTPFMMVKSELKRSDRRGVTPYHLLYVAMKIMKLTIFHILTIAFKHIDKDFNITREQIESGKYIDHCLENNHAFLRCIPNSNWYWAERKSDLFAMIRQLGKPTMFLTLKANEIGWVQLLQILYKLKNNGNEISEEMVSQLSYIQKSTLINEDAVTCAIYFNKLVNVLISLLQSKKCNPFGKYRVIHYFKRIEFQHCDSPHAHILLWLENAPKDMLGADKQNAISLIDNLVSVSAKESSGNIKFQTNRHTFTDIPSHNNKVTANKTQKYRFEAPFMPCRSTIILKPMKKEEPGFAEYVRDYKSIRTNLATCDYRDINAFYKDNHIFSDEHYTNILRAGITRPTVFVKREPSEKWHNTFNPFILNVLQSNIDIQFILEEYSCAAYVAEYISKTNKGISNLQRQIIEIMIEHPEFDIVEITRKMTVDMLHTVEITSQEAAWYLLREPMSKSSTVIAYIPTSRPIERQRIQRTQEELAREDLDYESIDIWKENWFDKYENRPEEFENISLAQFVANYVRNANNTYVKRKEPRVIRYRNYDIDTDFDEYRREMVTLHLPFRNEENEILAEMKFVGLYDKNKDLILQKRKEFEYDLNIQETIEICKRLCREAEILDDEADVQDFIHYQVEPGTFQQLYNNENMEINRDLTIATSNELGVIDRERENLTTINRFYGLMRMAFNKLNAVDKVLLDFISNRSNLSIFLFNCKSLKDRITNFNDVIVQKSKILLLSETCLNNEEQLDNLDNFNFIVQFNRPGIRNGGVAIRRNSNNRTIVVTAHMDLNLCQNDCLTVNSTAVGEICTAFCLLNNGQTILTVAIYITPNKSISQIIDFIHNVLLVYTTEGAALLNKNYDKMPIILSGDFNVNFASAEVQSLIEFLRSKFNLYMNNNPVMSITKSGSTINAVFTRYLNDLKSAIYTSYFSYHKPIISLLDYKGMDTSGK